MPLNSDAVHTAAIYTMYHNHQHVSFEVPLNAHHPMHTHHSEPAPTLSPTRFAASGTAPTHPSHQWAYEASIAIAVVIGLVAVCSVVLNRYDPLDHPELYYADG